MSDEAPEVKKTSKKRKSPGATPVTSAKEEATKIVKAPDEDKRPSDDAPADGGQGITAGFHHLRAQAHDSFHEGRDFVLTWDRRFKSALRERPYRTVLKAVGIGWFLGFLFTSRPRRRR